MSKVLSLSFLSLSTFKLCRWCHPSCLFHRNLNHYDLTNSETTPIADSSPFEAITYTHFCIISIRNGTCIVLLVSTRCYQPLRSLSSICLLGLLLFVSRKPATYAQGTCSTWLLSYRSTDRTAHHIEILIARGVKFGVGCITQFSPWFRDIWIARYILYSPSVISRHMNAKALLLHSPWFRDIQMQKDFCFTVRDFKTYEFKGTYLVRRSVISRHINTKVFVLHSPWFRDMNSRVRTSFTDPWFRDIWMQKHCRCTVHDFKTYEF